MFSRVIGRPPLRRLLPAIFLALGAAGIAYGQSPAPPDPGGVAVVGSIEGPIGPATVRHVEKLIDAATDRHAAVLVLRLDTPGGLSSSMRKVISRILTAPMPVVGYVAPPGAHAASAGTYILYATQIAAMAPGTNLGAATPIQIGGGVPGLPKSGKGDDKNAKPAPDASNESTEMRKATNDAIALIRSLAEMHGRNADWAESAVRDAATLTANQALQRGVIDVIAPNVPALLEKIDGRTVRLGDREVTLATAHLAVVRVGSDFVTQALALLSNPNVAFLLMIVGVYGLIFEFANPGGIGPGVVGAICLVLGLYALNQLPLDYAGLALVIGGIGFMIAEAFTPSFGALGAGGLAAFVIGAAMLIDTDSPSYRLSWWVIGGTAAVSGAFLVFLIGYMWKVYRRPAGSSDATRMIGLDAEVLDWTGREGHVWAESERWAARGDTSFAARDHVRIRAMDGLTVVVEPCETSETAAPEAPASAKGD